MAFLSPFPTTGYMIALTAGQVNKPVFYLPLDNIW